MAFVSLLRNCPSESEYDIVHERMSHTCITDRIQSNSYTNTYRPTRYLPFHKECRLAIIISATVIYRLKDGQLVTECCHAIYHTQITQALIPCNNGRV